MPNDWFSASSVVTLWSQCCHSEVTLRSICGHFVVTLWSHCCHSVVILWSLCGHSVVTCSEHSQSCISDALCSHIVVHSIHLHGDRSAKDQTGVCVWHAAYDANVQFCGQFVSQANEFDHAEICDDFPVQYCPQGCNIKTIATRKQVHAGNPVGHAQNLMNSRSRSVACNHNPSSRICVGFIGLTHSFCFHGLIQFGRRTRSYDNGAIWD